MAKEALVVRHVAFEDLGSFAPVLAARGYAIEYVEAAGADFSRINPLGPGLLVVMGGPIGACEDRAYPFLVQETRLIEARLAADRPTLGVCLGAQLMARALGAAVFPGGRKEIGWGPLRLTEAGRGSALRHLDGQHTSVLHWHGDTFELPEGGVLLASTEAYPNQAFSWGRRSLALQFHPEVTGDGLERWFVGHACEIAATPGLTVEGLRAETARHAPALVAPAKRFLEEWLDAVEEPS